jgi:hypothetical protein
VLTSDHWERLARTSGLGKYLEAKMEFDALTTEKISGLVPSWLPTLEMAFALPKCQPTGLSCISTRAQDVQLRTCWSLKMPGSFLVPH